MKQMNKSPDPRHLVPISRFIYFKHCCHRENASFIPWKGPYALVCELPEGQAHTALPCNAASHRASCLGARKPAFGTRGDCERFLLDQAPSINFTVSGLGKTWNWLRAGVCWHAGAGLPSVRILHFLRSLHIPARFSPKLRKTWNLHNFIFNCAYQSLQGKLFHITSVMLK